MDPYRHNSIQGRTLGGGGVLPHLLANSGGATPLPDILRQKMFPMKLNNVLNLINRMCPYFKLYEVIIIVNTMVFKIIDHT